MRGHSFAHLGNPDLRSRLVSQVAQDRASTATLVALIAEFDARKLYLPEAYPSMFAFCVHELHLSEDSALKRIRAARTARQFPVIFEALAGGRLNLSGVVRLTPYLTRENADELLTAAARHTRTEIEELLARRFPRPEPLAMVQALPATAPGPNPDLAPGAWGQVAPGPVGEPAPRAKVTPVAAERSLLQLAIGRSFEDKLRYAQDLLGHALPCGDIARVLERGLDALIEKLERRKFAATPRPRPSERPSSNPRHVPAQVKRAVWERDGGRCTFVSDTGRRCSARRMLEFDHVEAVARGGRASVAGIRLRCRAHNQYAAECAFGADFMRHKRDEARRQAEARRQEIEAQARARAAAEEVVAPLRVLGFRADEARRAAALCESIPDASLEDRVRRALSYFQPRGRTVAPATIGLG